MPAYRPGKVGGGLGWGRSISLKRENVHQNPCWHSEREFVHYDMFLPVTSPAKIKNKKKCV